MNGQHSTTPTDRTRFGITGGPMGMTAAGTVVSARLRFTKR